MRGTSSDGAFNYEAIGATAPSDAGPAPKGYRLFKRTVRIGHGPDRWHFASEAVLAWGIKVRSGFRIANFDGTPAAGHKVVLGERYWLVARVGPARIWEPVRIVDVLDGSNRAGFAYGTLTGHPVSGEEAFLVEYAEDGSVTLTITSISRPAGGMWRLAFPLLAVAQRYYRRRYFRALAGPQAT
jgi:uncharacterized protein (UPF0548 family)